VRSRAAKGIAANGVSESAFFTQGDSTVFVPGVVDNSGHILGVFDALTFQLPVNGSGLLANVEFNAVATSTSPLVLSNVFLNLSDTGFDVTTGVVCVTAPRASACVPSGSSG
jgi:hypothetical protein